MQAQLGRAVADQGDGDDPGEPAGFEDLGDLGFDSVAGFAGLAAGQAAGELGELAAGVGQGLVESLRTAWRAGRRVGHDDAPLGAEDDLRVSNAVSPGNAVRVDRAVAAAGHGQQVGVVRRGQRPDEMRTVASMWALVGFGVLAGVKDQGELVVGFGQSAPNNG